MSRTAIALALCLLVAGCAAPTAQPPAAGADASATTDGSAVETTANSTEASDSTETAADSDATTTEAAVEDGYDIPVSGGTISVEHERVFARTEGLLDVNVSPPTIIVVKSAAEIRADTGGVSDPGEESESRSFAGVMGIGKDDDGEESAGEGSDGDGSGDEGSDGDGSGDEGSDGDGSGDEGSDGEEKDGDGSDGEESDDDGSDGEESDDDGVSVAAYAPSAHSVIVNERMTVLGRERVLERTMAHEFVHNVQFHQRAFERVQRELGLRHSYSRDRYLTYLSVIEGTAVFVAAAYDREYLAGNSATITDTERYRSSSSGVKYAISKYYFGSRYLSHRYDSPKNVSSVYDDPPRTTEQLLHNDTNGSEEPRLLSARVRPGENRTLGRTNTNGELFTRIALGTELNESRAAAAAAGWGADRLVPVVPENETGNRSFVWATRWDSPAEADEFEIAFEEYLASRANLTAGSEEVWRDGKFSFRVVRVSNETVVLLAGEEPFVRNATVSGTNASVSVSAA